MERIAISIVTATYNRATLLPRLYESLQAQAFRNFEWIIVDDGSSDDTACVTRAFAAEGLLRIVLLSQANAGKHVASNAGFAVARGELTTTVDSDDWLLPDSLAILWETWTGIEHDHRVSYAGVGGLCATSDGQVIGDRFPRDQMDSYLFELFQVRRTRGDKLFAFRTELLCAHPFPVFEGERFLTEGIVWNAVGANYKMRFINRVLQAVEYQSDGLSARSVQLRARNPLGAIAYYRQLAAFNYSWRSRYRALVNCARFMWHAGDKSPHIPELRSPMGALMRMVGGLLYLRDWRKLGR